MLALHIKEILLIRGGLPKGRIWRKPCEGLDYGGTAKGMKEGSCGKLGKLMVAISFGKLMVAISFGKGIIDCEQYDKMSGNYFKGHMSRKFPTLFQTADKLPSELWIQDGCPCQNSKAAKMAMSESEADLLSIPPRSPDINPIKKFVSSCKKGTGQTNNQWKYSAGNLQRICDQSYKYF